MNNFLAFVNFTEASSLAVKQAAALAKLHGGKLHLCHVSQGESDHEVERKLSQYAKEVEEHGVEVSTLHVKGDFFAEAPAVTKRLDPEMVIIGSVGEEGMSISHFGSAVYKLVRSLPSASLIIQSNAVLATNGYRKALLPLSEHKNLKDVVNSLRNIMASDAKVTILDVAVNGAEMDEMLSANAKAVQFELDKYNINWTLKSVKVSKASLGHAQAILDEMAKEGMDLIAMPADVAKRSLLFGKMDKEALISNAHGFPVLCLNTDIA